MQMRDEYVVYEGKVYVRAAHLKLCALATVYHKLFVAYAHYLRGGIMSGGG